MEKLLQGQHSQNIKTKPGNRMVAVAILALLIPTTSVAQIADGKCKFLGNVIAGSVPADFKTYWNQVTPENAGKWGSVESIRDDPQWANLDLAYNYAKNNEMLFKQHTFVWGQQAPTWIGPSTTLTAQEQADEVEEWIKGYCERYPQTDYIDVVNEPLHEVPSYAAALGGSGATGWDWVVWSFQKARQYCPNAKLALNDYNILSNTNATTTYLQIIDVLKEKGLIDIIGEQGHFLETTPQATITSNLDRLYAKGLPIHISEYDVHLSSDSEQETKLKEQFQMFWEHPGVHGITFWGYRQGAIWRENAYLVRTDNTERPALTWLKTYMPSSTGGTFCYTVGVEDTKVGLKVYPNPAVNGTITLESRFDNTDIEILDVHGRRLKTLTVSGAQPEIVELGNRPGVYILRSLNTRGKNVQKIIVR